MGARCLTCDSPHRARIEFGLARGVPVRALARRFGLSKDCVYRHRKHVSPALMQELRAKALMPAADLERLRIEESSGLLEHLVAQRGHLYRLADTAEELGDIHGACGVHGRITANLELTGKLLDMFASHATSVTQNILVAPQYLSLRQALVQALRPYSEARRAVVAVLREIEGNAIEIGQEEHDPKTFDLSGTAVSLEHEDGTVA